MESKKGSKQQLIWRFLKKSKRFFAVSIVMTGVAALCDMMIPQIIRTAIDNVVTG